jgi:hypothetical protein
MGGKYNTYGAQKGLYGVLVGKPELNRPHERPRRRWEENIKTDLQKVRWNVWGWTESMWLRIGTGGEHLCMW